MNRDQDIFFLVEPVKLSVFFGSRQKVGSISKILDPETVAYSFCEEEETGIQTGMVDATKNETKNHKIRNRNLYFLVVLGYQSAVIRAYRYF